MSLGKHPTKNDKKTHLVSHQQQVNIIQIVLAEPTNGGGNAQDREGKRLGAYEREKEPV
jgi:hypothetical protein